MALKLLAKQKGEWAEVCFAAEVLRRGWRIARPYGDSCAYDCIVDVGGRLSRVQVKSVHWRDAGRQYPYRVKMWRGKRNQLGYSAREVDVLAVLVVPRRAWYIVPISAIEKRVALGFGADRRSCGALERYRQAWWVLRTGTQEAGGGKQEKQRLSRRG
jgi:hypothetical protein